MINIVLMAVVTAVAIGLGVLRGARILGRNRAATLDSAHKHLPEVRVLLPACVLSSIAALIVFSRYDALWLVPAGIDCWALPILYACSAGFLCYLLAAALRFAYRSAHPERHKLALAAALLLVGLGSMYLKHSLPVYPGLSDRRTPDGCILQSSPFTCAPAAAANILALRGIAATEREMARLAGTTDLGTAPGEIVRCFRRMGIAAHKAILTLAQLQQRRSPTLLLVDYPEMSPLSHAIVLESLDDNHALVIDPLKGRVQLTLRQLQDQWRGYAVCVENDPAQ